MGRVCTSAAVMGQSIIQGEGGDQSLQTSGDRMDMGHQISFLLISHHEAYLMQEDFPLG